MAEQKIWFLVWHSKTGAWSTGSAADGNETRARLRQRWHTDLARMPLQRPPWPEDLPPLAGPSPDVPALASDEYCLAVLPSKQAVLSLAQQMSQRWPEQKAPVPLALVEDLTQRLQKLQ